MKVKIKKLAENAVIPSYSKKGDAGLDLVATKITFEKLIDEDGLTIAAIDFGISLEIPEGYVGLLLPRSSIYKNNAILANSVGVIDSGYRGSVIAKFITDEEFFGYKVGDKAAQLIIIPYPQIEFEEVDELSNSDRAEGGFGSTGS